MKKLAVILMVALMAISMAACGNGGSGSSAAAGGTSSAAAGDTSSAAAGDTGTDAGESSVAGVSSEVSSEA